MAVRVVCPFCKTPCQLEDKFIGFPVQCHLCRQAFIAKSPETPKVAKAAPAALPVARPEPPSPATAEPVTKPIPLAPTPIVLAPAATPTRAPMLPTPAASRVAPGLSWLDVAAVTSVGRERERNEDSCLVLRQCWASRGEQHDMALLVVADGMGGYEAGDQASQLAIRTLGSILAGLLSAALSGQMQDAASPGLGTSLDLAIRETNKAVCHESRNNPKCKGMGATAVVAVVYDNQAHIAHVGDCRAYHQRGDQFTQVTRDHTLVERMVELGQLSRQEAENHHLRNEVTQALGKRSDTEPSAHHLKLERNDWLVLACDGLHTHVDQPTLKDQIRAATSAHQLATRLVDLANEGGGTDNCTVIAARLC